MASSRVGAEYSILTIVPFVSPDTSMFARRSAAVTPPPIVAAAASRTAADFAMPCSVTMSVVLDSDARTAGAGVNVGEVTVIDTVAEWVTGIAKAAPTPTRTPATVPAAIVLQRRPRA